MDVLEEILPAFADYVSGRPPDTAKPAHLPVARLLWQNRALLLRCAGIGAAVSILIAFLLPPRYEARVVMMPPNDRSSSSLMTAAAMMGSGGSGGGLSGLLGVSSRSAVLVEILKSGTIQDRLIQQFSLQKVYGKKHTEDLRRTLSENTKVTQSLKSDIVTVEVSDRNPDRAAMLAGAYAEELNRTLAELNTSAAHRGRTFVEERLRFVKEDLDSAVAAMTEFSSKNKTVDVSAQTKALVSSAADLQGKLVAAETELRGLQQIYADDNVRIRSVRARIEELRSQVTQIAGSSDPRPGELFPPIGALPALAATYSNLSRRVKTQEVVYELLTKQYEMAKIEEAKEIPTVGVLEKPIVPYSRSGPPRLGIILLGVAISIVYVIVWVIGMQHWKNLAPSHKAFAAEILGTIFFRRP